MLSAVNDLVPSEMPGVFLGEEGSAIELPGVEAHDVAVIPKPTGVDLGCSQPEPPQLEAVFDSAAFVTTVDGGPKPQAVAEINQAVPPKVGMAACNARIRTLQSSMFPACKVISTRLHWLRLLLPSERVRHQWHLLKCPSSS